MGPGTCLDVAGRPVRISDNNTFCSTLSRACTAYGKTKNCLVILILEDAKIILEWILNL